MWPFRSVAVVDRQLGELTRKGVFWMGRIGLGERDPIALAVRGDESGPNSDALALAHEFPGRYPELRGAISAALLQHVRPYAEEAGLPIVTPEDAWAGAQPVHVSVGPFDGRTILEIGFEADWDEEHVLGARFVDWRLSELNGSVVFP